MNKFKITTVGMTENKFWNLVKLADWANPKVNCDTVKIHYLKTLSKEECKNFRATISKAYIAIDNLISLSSINDELGVGDDGYSDLLHHIIGLGEDEYYKHINNLLLVKKLANSRGYRESFIYCVPYDGDYEKGNDYTIDHVISIAKSSIKEIDMFLKMDEGSEWLKPISNELGNMKSIFEAFLKDPTEESLKFLTTFKELIEKNATKIDKFFEKNGDELPRKFTADRKDGSNFNGMCSCLFTNTIDDAEKVLEYLKS